MTELKLKPTTFYEQTLVAPSPNNLWAPGCSQLGSVATGAALTGANLVGYADRVIPNLGGTVFFSDEEREEKRFWCASAPAFTGYYVVVTLPSVPNSAEGGLNYLLADELRLPCPVVVGAPLRASEDVRTLESQRQERNATAELAQRVHELLPGFSEQDLGRLVGVSRITWRGWSRGETASRRGTRQRLLRLERILNVRSRIDPDGSLTNWLDSPVGVGVDVTPARLLAEGRDGLVAILAARMPTPQLDDQMRLQTSSTISGLLHSLNADERFAARREIYAGEGDEDNDNS